MSVSKSKVLIIDDDTSHAEAIAEGIKRSGFDAMIAGSGEEGLAVMDREELDIIITDLVMAGVDGMEVLREARKRSEFTEVVMVTGYGSVESAVQAIQEGAAHYITKPVNILELRAVLDKIVENQAIKIHNLELRKQLDQKFGFETIIGSSKPMVEVFKLLRQVAPTNVTVMVQGESGTGKELIARAIHNNSPRKAFPFVAVNCAALSEGLIESELFGHEKGAFTGAVARKAGKFEYANRGTLFLDEVGDMPLSIQVKLLRVLEEREIVRVGSNEPISVDVRLISATNQNLVEAVGQGEFREDLYFRLRVVSIDLAPLRERTGDIPLLLDAFIEEFTKTHGKKVKGISPEAMTILGSQPWPGNVRELRNVIENMVVTAQNEILQVSDIPVNYLDGVEGHPSTISQLAGVSLADLEKECIRQTLALTGGNREKTAKMLGIGERTLYRKINEYGLRNK